VEENKSYHRIRLTVAYDGTNYVGWQVQPNGVSIQAVLQEAIEDLVQEKVNVTGASRTDSGVHALGQVVVFDTTRTIPPDQYARALNQRLPRDIVVQSSEEVSPDFHPRYTTVEKTYEYRILNRRIPLPCERMYSYFVPRKLDVEKMREAAKLFVGEHDFTDFSSQRRNTVTTVRTIYECRILQEGDIITLRIRGNGFLYNMVRIIMGMLLKVGVGQKSIEDIQRAFDCPQGRAAAPTAPACGLTLVEIKYPEE
jgi:tRNA pseudouridine38-40 synthase